MPPTLCHLLASRAAGQPEARAFGFLVDGESNELWLSYEQVLRRSVATAHFLQSEGARGERVVLLFPPGLDYITALFGCLLAGAIAVPAYPPDPSRIARTLPRLEALIADSRARFAFTTPPLRSLADFLCRGSAPLSRLRWLAIESASAPDTEHWTDPGPTPDDLALLQYTSGSTGSPRGVMLTHRNLLHNSAAIHRLFGHGENSRGVIWLPPYHDMGLIGGILQPLYGGFPVVLLSPLDFLAQPMRWLRAISRHRATTSGGPNFAYDLCARKATPEDLATLNLASWRIAFNGAEPVRSSTIQRFAETFAPCGFDLRAMYPCYGLAEATLIATGSVTTREPVTRHFLSAPLERGEAVLAASDGTTSEGSVKALVSSGVPLSDQDLIIVDPHSSVHLREDRVGEIWVRGASVAAGYWSRPDETLATFGARLDGADDIVYLRTGDLGFIHECELFVTGRRKDLIIVRGRNLSPADIEQSAVASHTSLRPGCAAAFSVEHEDEAKVVLVLELDPRKAADPAEVIRAIRRAVAEEHGLSTHGIALLAPGTIPKTSSGKIQRHACKAAYLANELDTVAIDVAPDLPLNGPRELPEQREGWLASWLAARLSMVLHRPLYDADLDRPLVELGLDSLRSVELRAELERALGTSLPLEWLIGGASTRDLVRACANASPREPKAGGVVPRVPRAPDMPLSHPQEEIWLAARLDGNSSNYHIPVTLQLRGPLRVDWMEDALAQIIERHEILRTCFPEVGRRPVQQVQSLATGTTVLPLDDLRTLPQPDRDARVRTIARAVALEPFDLAHAPLHRARLLRLEDERYILLFTIHHAIADGWSMGILVRELAAMYSARHREAPLRLKPLPFQYADFSSWQRNELAGARLEELLDHWRQVLADLPHELRLPFESIPPREDAQGGGTLRALLEPKIADALATSCARERVTPFMWLLTVYALLLLRYTGQDDVPVGVAVLGRDVPGSEQLIGNFINMVVMRMRLHGNPSFSDLLHGTRRDALQCFEHQDMPFGVLARRILSERVASHGQLFRTAFGTQNQPREQLDLPGVEAELLSTDHGLARIDLTLWISETPSGLECAWTHTNRSFDAARVAELHRRFAAWLELSLEHPDARISSFPLEPSPASSEGLDGALRKLEGRRRSNPGPSHRGTPKTPGPSREDAS